MRAVGSSEGASSFCGVLALGSSPLFAHPRMRTPPRSPRPASDQVDCCLPRHRQAVRLRCFCHWRVTDVFPAGPPCPPLEGRAALMTIACPTFSSLDERQGIKRGHFIVLRCACPRIITAVSTFVSTRRLAYASSTLTATRKRLGAIYRPLCRGTGRQ